MTFGKILQMMMIAITCSDMCYYFRILVGHWSVISHVIFHNSHLLQLTSDENWDIISLPFRCTFSFREICHLNIWNNNKSPHGSYCTVLQDKMLNADIYCTLSFPFSCILPEEGGVQSPIGVNFKTSKFKPKTFNNDITPLTSFIAQALPHILL